jgi:hypothetical protein
MFASFFRNFFENNEDAIKSHFKKFLKMEAKLLVETSLNKIDSEISLKMESKIVCESIDADFCRWMACACTNLILYFEKSPIDGAQVKFFNQIPWNLKLGSGTYELHVRVH